MPNMKPRSGVVTDGLERSPARGMLRAVGMGDEDWVKPQIGIASSWNEIAWQKLRKKEYLQPVVFQCSLELFQFPTEFQWATKECTSH
jgi:dihydroxyacid dehydratase/phosphogluconate dehydratase